MRSYKIKSGWLTIIYWCYRTTRCEVLGMFGAQQEGVNKSDKRILNHHKMEVGTELILWKKQMYIAGGEGKSI